MIVTDECKGKLVKTNIGLCVEVYKESDNLPWLPKPSLVIPKGSTGKLISYSQPHSHYVICEIEFEKPIVCANGEQARFIKSIYLDLV